MGEVELLQEIRNATKRKPEDLATTCVWCNEHCIPIEMRNNARGFGWYGICPKCKKETVIYEVDFTREF